MKERLDSSLLLKIEKVLTSFPEEFSYDKYVKQIARDVVNLVAGKTLEEKDISFCEIKKDVLILKSIDGEILSKKDKIKPPHSEAEIVLNVFPHGWIYNNENNIKCPFSYQIKVPYICIQIEREMNIAEIDNADLISNNDRTTRYLRFPFKSIDESKHERCILEALSFNINHHFCIIHEMFIPFVLQLKKTEGEFKSFVHGVSHYLKSPLSSIQGFSTLLYDLSREKLDFEVLHYCTRITENAKLLEKMLNELVFISRLKRGGEKILNTVDIIKDILKEFKQKAIEKNITFSISKNLPYINVRMEHAVELFHCLLENAIKFSKENGTVKVKHDGKMFYIEDNGRGISRQNLVRVFNIFFTTCSKETGSTGAGLYIVKKIVELYGGNIKIESEKGKGTKVSFKLPLK